MNKILIIEPDNALARETAEILREIELEPTLVDSHFKALTLLEDNPFSIILVSADDSGITGLDFCRILSQRRIRSGLDFPYLILMGENWHRTAICESRPEAHDFLVRPYLAGELKWRVLAGLNYVREMRDLKEAIFLDPVTGALNMTGLQRAMREEINRLGRKKAWFTVGILDFAHRDWMELSQSRDAITWARKKAASFLKQFLREYDRVAIINEGRICVLSGDCDYECFTEMLSRIRDSLKDTRLPLPEGIKADIEFTGVFKSMIVSSGREDVDQCFEYLWNWIKSVDMLPEKIQGGVSMLDKTGLRDSGAPGNLTMENQ